MSGYDEINAQRLKQIELPPKIKCRICLKHRNHAGFSQKQLNDLRYKIDREGGRYPTGGVIRCRTCTGTPADELGCVACGEVKVLDCFAKVQRRTPQIARCMDCVVRHEEAEPGMEIVDPKDVYKNEGDMSDGEEDDRETGLVSQLGESVSNLNLSDSQSTFTSSSYQSESGGVRLSNRSESHGPLAHHGYDRPGATWITDPTRRRKVAREIASATPMSSRQFEKSAIPSTPSSIVETMADQEESMSVKSMVTYGSSGFARVKGGKIPKPPPRIIKPRLWGSDNDDVLEGKQVSGYSDGEDDE